VLALLMSFPVVSLAGSLNHRLMDWQASSLLSIRVLERAAPTSDAEAEQF